MSFEVGQLVVCVRDDFHPAWVKGGYVLAKRSHVYEVRSTIKLCKHDCKGIGIYLTEIVNKPIRWCCFGICEPAFVGYFFRPIDKDAGDLFKKLVEPARLIADTKKIFMPTAKQE